MRAKNSSPRNRPNDVKRFIPRRNLIRQRSIRRIVRNILLTSEESHQRPALLRHVISDGTAEHWVFRFQRIENTSLRDGTPNFQFHLTLNGGESSQVGW
jgi:hypothetical protein